MNAPYSLLAQLENIKDKAHPPVHLWNPDNVQDLDMVIARDGTWYYMGSPIERQRLVRLFSLVLRLEDDGEYYLVTPVEKCRIKVEDAPFQAILLAVEGEGRQQVLRFTTNIAEEVVADAAHPIRVAMDAETGEPAPYVMVRDGLEALIARNVYYELANLLVTEEVDGMMYDGVWSAGCFFEFIESAKLD